VIPRGDEDVIAAVETCRARKVPILARGCGTSLAGQCCNVAVIIDFSKYMNRILALDPDGRFAKVQPGLINDDLRHAAARFGLTFAPDPATLTSPYSAGCARQSSQWCESGEADAIAAGSQCAASLC
jgi:FAD/FMN-containing dehydrogenase